MNVADDVAGPKLLTPRWPTPATVRAASTTRLGGRSHGPHAAFNLGEHCGDSASAVASNRAALRATLSLDAEPCWLHQVHGARVLDAASPGADRAADAAVAFGPGAVCVVLTADCLPVLLCDVDGTRVAAAHAGWRGLAAGVIEATVSRLGAAPERLMAWLGPAIGPRAYEIGPEVREALRDGLGTDVDDAFGPSPSGRWLADLQAIARLRLRRAGVTSVHAAERCTHTESDRFYSYRRDGETGRMASLIWLA